MLEGVIALYNEKRETDTYVASLNVSACETQDHIRRCNSREIKAFYGSGSSYKMVKGYLMYAHGHGCEMFDFSVPKRPWIALIQRGGCRFAKKIENAINHNASGAIIYGEKPGNTFGMLLGETTIVAVSTTFERGNELRMAMNRSDVYVKISFDRIIEGRRRNTISVLFVSISFIVLMVISLAWLVFYYIQRFRFLYARDKSERRLTSAAKKAITKLSSRTISKKDEEDGNDKSCAVCLEEYKYGDTLRTLPCSHEFHKHCVDPWLIEHRTCPMCKTNILKQLGMLHSVDEDYQESVTFSITPNDVDSGVLNDGLSHESRIERSQENQALPRTEDSCVADVTPVETTSNCELSYVRTEKMMKMHPASMV